MRIHTRKGPSDKTKKFGRLVEPESIASSLLGPTSKAHPPSLIWQYLYVQLLLRITKNMKMRAKPQALCTRIYSVKENAKVQRKQEDIIDQLYKQSVESLLLYQDIRYFKKDKKEKEGVP